MGFEDGLGFPAMFSPLLQPPPLAGLPRAVEQEAAAAAAERDGRGGASGIKSFSERNYLCSKHRHCEKQQQSCAPPACPAQSRAWCCRCSRSVPTCVWKRLLVCSFLGCGRFGFGFLSQSGSFTSNSAERAFQALPVLISFVLFFFPSSFCCEEAEGSVWSSEVTDELTVNLF